VSFQSYQFSSIPSKNLYRPTYIVTNNKVEKWQSEWTQSTKGRTIKEFFPEVTERLKMKINLTQNFTTMVRGHGKTK